MKLIRKVLPVLKYPFFYDIRMWNVAGHSANVFIHTSVIGIKLVNEVKF